MRTAHMMLGSVYSVLACAFSRYTKRLHAVNVASSLSPRLAQRLVPVTWCQYAPLSAAMHLCVDVHALCACAPEHDARSHSRAMTTRAGPRACYLLRSQRRRAVRAEALAP